MPDDKAVKKVFKQKAEKDFEKYYPVGFLRRSGFHRSRCLKCGTMFWSTQARAVCGDPSCVGGFSFIGNTPAKHGMDYIETWRSFSSLMSSLGYTPIRRYPVTARWRKDTDFVQASIYDFQPYVVSGEVEPPANPLVIPQFCLRFNDIDNVGITGSHYTGFVMIGQHAFMPPVDWNQEKYFSDIHAWLTKGLGLPDKEIVFHEDAWAGGGNFGPSMEFFSRGIELGNQVYMLYESTASGPKEIPLRVLDMGMGHERNTWFSTGLPTSYEAAFPSVCRYLYDVTGLGIDETVKKILPYSSFLNIDEISDVDVAWKAVSAGAGLSVEEIKRSLLPLSALYSIAEHSRSLLVALSDGALPSNVGGGYNLRMLFRRMLSFIDKYGWSVDVHSLLEQHSSFLKPLFPELEENLEDVKKTMDVEREKYLSSRERSKRLLSSLSDKPIDRNALETYYQSSGINPADIAAIRPDVKVPEDFYSRISEKHSRPQQSVEEAVVSPAAGLPDTRLLFYEDERLSEFSATVLAVRSNMVVLDKTAFYGTSGGQLHDVGTMESGRGKDEIVNVVKQAGIIIHVMKETPQFSKGDTVKCVVDRKRRRQLMQHHTATHVVNAAARSVLGNHVNQAGAHKDIAKARIDITHYSPLSPAEQDAIARAANTIVAAAHPVRKSFMPRTDAEKKYGFRIYQGGIVPGRTIRIVDIQGVDVEACGGTHLDNTSEIGSIRILKSSKISDSIIRIEFVAGSASSSEDSRTKDMLSELSVLLAVPFDQIPSRAEEVFVKWKKARKLRSFPDNFFVFSSSRKDSLSEDELLRKTATILKTQPEHAAKTLRRFLADLDEAKKKKL